MLRILAFIVSILLLSSCSTKDKVIPQSSISGKDITASDSYTQEMPLNVALIIPQDQNGSSIIQAAQLAIEESGNNNINLSIIDSNNLNSSPESVLSELEKQQVVIGPLYGPDTQKLIEIIPNKNVPILSLSNDSSIKSDSLLIMGISPGSQTYSVMNYAIGQGITSFHLLLPENKFGHLINDAVETILSEKNSMIYTANWYIATESEQAINNLVTNLDHNDGTQAIFMPQGDKKALHLLNKALSQHTSKVKLLGLQGWDNSEVLSLNHLEGAIFLRKNLNHGSFNTKFNNLFGTNAKNIDFIAYNGLLMAINMNNAKLPLNKQSIIQYNQDDGKYSNVSFNQEGLCLYDLPIVTIENKEFVEKQK